MPEQRKQLETWSRGQKTPHKLVMRSRMILGCADGKQNKVVAGELGVDERTVGATRKRFVAKGLEGIVKDKTRPGRKPELSHEKELEIIEATLQSKPKNATHWSTRRMAKQVGVSRMAVQRVWKKHGLKPHLIETFKLSNDPRFVEKLYDIVGLYMNPPERALVISVDEKSQIQALDRTQAVLPMRPGAPERWTHDYKRHGTTTLFAALNVLDGKIIAECKKRHRHQEYLAFLKKIDAETPQHLDLHLIVDNYATHKHKKVKSWLQRHPRFHVHFTPTGSSWLNLVERFFGQITEEQIRRGVFKSVPELVRSITSYIEAHNKDPKPFKWTASAEEILRKVNKTREAIGTQALGTPH